MAQVTEVEAQRLDPTLLGVPCEVVERGRDGEVRHGLVLKHYVVPVEGPVRLVGEVTTVVVEREQVVRFFTVPVDPGRWTGAPAPVAYPAPVAQPVQQPVPPVQPVVPGSAAGWGGQPPAPPVAGGVAPWLRQPPGVPGGPGPGH